MANSPITQLEKGAPPASGLLEGEDPRTIHAQDARHWINIYNELLRFKERIISRMGERRDGLSPETQVEVDRTDLALLEDQRRRYQERLEFWYERHWELEGLHLDPTDRSLGHRAERVSLTQREYQLVELLLAHPNRYFNSRQIADQGWGRGDLSPEEVRGYVVRVRRKLEALQGIPCRLANQPRKGYALLFDDRP